jgi:hypothetical protein
MNSFLSIEEIKYLSAPHISHCKSPTKNKKSFFYSMENSIFREFKRDNDNFIGTDKYFISEEVENKNHEYLGFNFSKNYLYNGYCKLKGIYSPYKKYFCEKMTPCKDDTDLYISLDANRIYKDDNSSYLHKEYINLILVDDISLNLNENEITKRDIFKKIIDNDLNINDNFIKSLYNDDEMNINMSKDISLKIKNNNISLENMEINTKYLFKIHFSELPLNYNEERFL